MIEFSHVSYAYRGAKRFAVDDVSLAVGAGERVVVCGDNGSGKSTLARLATGAFESASGTVLVDGQAPDARLFAVVRQDPAAQIVSAEVLDEVCFGPANLGLPREEVIARAERALETCGIAHLTGCDTGSLTASEQQLVALAGALAMEAPYLVLDEVTSQLDAGAAARVATIVDTLVADGTGVLEVAHDKRRLEGATRVVRLGEPYEPEPLTYVQHTADAAPHTLEAHGLELDDVLSGVSLAAAGEILVISGASGTGKSALARMLVGVLEADAGTVTLDGKPVTPGMVGLTLQRSREQLFATTVWDDIAFGPANRGMSGQALTDHIDDIAAELGIRSELMDRSPFELSGGQAHRVALAGVLALDARAFALDEPLAGLDVSGVRLVSEALLRRAAEGAAIVVVTSKPADYAAIASRMLVLEGGVLHG